LSKINSHSKILITGADGFIGSHLCEYLVSLNYNVKAFVYYNSFGSWGWLDNVYKNLPLNLEIVMGDIRDPHSVEIAMRDCSSVIHLASLIGIPFSYNSPDLYLQTNVQGTLNLLQAARKLKISKFIHTSTSEVYGTAKYVPIDEKHPLHAQSPYAASKIAADQMVNSFYKSFELPTITLRPFNTFGPRQSARAIIPTIITQLLTNSPLIKLGSTLPTRNYNFVLDTIRAFEFALKSEVGFGEVFNVGSNFEISVGELVKIVLELTGKEISIKEDIDRLRPLNSEVMQLSADSSKILKTLNWYPYYSGLDGFRKGLMETITWFSKSENIDKYKTKRYNI